MKKLFTTSIKSATLAFAMVMGSAALLATPPPVAKTVYSIVADADVATSTHWSLTSGGASCACTPDFTIDAVHIETDAFSVGSISVGAGASLFITSNSVFSVTGTLILDAGSAVNISAGSGLSVSGDLVNNGTAITSNGNIGLSGNYTGYNSSSIGGSGGLKTGGIVSLVGGSATTFGSGTSCGVAPCAAGTTPLPITLISFSANNNGTGVSLSWSTGSEINNDYFIVQKSVDGANFETLEQVAGAGNSSHVNNYAIVDNGSVTTVTYYRLKQVDFDGTATHSYPVAIESAQAAGAELSVFPNPASGSVNLSFTNADKGSLLNVTITDISGKVVYANTSVTSSERTYNNFDASSLASGMYVVNAVCNGNSYHEKLMVSRVD